MTMQERNKRYRLNHKESIKINRKNSRKNRTQEQIEIDKERLKKWRNENRQKFRDICKKYRDKIRLEILSHYSNGNICCNCCGEKQIKFMALDHINNDGNEHRKTVKQYMIYVWIKRNNFPPMFQVLCHNCNMAKALYGSCPHKNL